MRGGPVRYGLRLTAAEPNEPARRRSSAGSGGSRARRLLARPLRPEEMKVVSASAGDLLAFYKANPKDAGKLIAVGESRPDPAVDVPTLAAWTMLANELMNLDEVLNK